MTTHNVSLFDAIETLDNEAKIPALRTIAHSAMARCIGAIRQGIRNRTNEEREAALFKEDLDQRNEQDGEARGSEEVSTAMRFNRNIPPLRLAEMLHAVYQQACNELGTLTTSKWDAPLTPQQMLEFMTNNAQTLDKALVSALAAAVKTDESTIERMHELQAVQERKQLQEATPEILATFESLSKTNANLCIDDLPVVDHHQLGVKTVAGIRKAKDKILMTALRTRKMSDLGAIPIIENAAEEMLSWLNAFEKEHHKDITEALENGRNLATADSL